MAPHASPPTLGSLRLSLAAPLLGLITACSSGGSPDSSPDATAAGGQAGQPEDGAGGAPGTGGAVPAPDSVCPAEAPCRILSVGDGLAAGSGSETPGAFRPALAAELKKRGKSTFVFVGGQGTGEDHHDGRDDRDAAALLTDIDGLVKAAKPHIVVINIGSEDVEKDQDLASLPDRVHAVVEKVRAALPGALIVVAGMGRGLDSAFNKRATAMDKTMSEAVTGWGDEQVKYGRAGWYDAKNPNGKPDDVSLDLVSGLKYYPSEAGYARFALAVMGPIVRVLSE